jgi:hypothetical protein
VQRTLAVDDAGLVEMQLTFVKVGQWLTSPPFQSAKFRSCGTKYASEAVRSLALTASNHDVASSTAVK